MRYRKEDNSIYTLVVLYTHYYCDSGFHWPVILYLLCLSRSTGSTPSLRCWHGLFNCHLPILLFTSLDLLPICPLSTSLNPRLPFYLVLRLISAWLLSTMTLCQSVESGKLTLAPYFVNTDYLYFHHPTSEISYNSGATSFTPGIHSTYTYTYIEIYLLYGVLCETYSY
jgi:hypothetical protein